MKAFNLVLEDSVSKRKKDLREVNGKDVTWMQIVLAGIEHYEELKRQEERSKQS